MASKQVSEERKGVTVVHEDKLNRNILPVVDTRQPSMPEPSEEFNVNSRRESGKVLSGTDRDMIRLVEEIDKAENGCGVFASESLKPSADGNYELGVHYRPDHDDVKDMKGAFGSVKCFEDCNTCYKFIIKKVEESKFNKTEACIPEHKNICRVIGIRRCRREIWLYMDWAGVSLDKVVPPRPFTLDEVIDLTRQGLEGLVHLKKHQIRHLDIKPNNMCLLMSDSEWKLVYIDFGTARFNHESNPTTGFTAYYMSPELCQYVKGVRADLSSNDMYQFGLVLLYIVSGGKHVMLEMANARCQFIPGWNEFNEETRRQILKDTYYEMMKREPAIGQKAVERFCPKDYALVKDLLDLMLESDTRKRIQPLAALTICGQLYASLQRKKMVLNTAQNVSMDESLDSAVSEEEVPLPEPNVVMPQREERGNLPELGQLLSSEDT